MDPNSNAASACLSHSVDLKSNNYDYNPSSINKSDLVESTVDNTDTILSLYWKNGILGAASYNSHLSEIQILHDIVESKLDFKILNSLFMQVRPGNIVVSNLQDGIFLKLVKQLAHENKINIYTSPTNIDDYKSDNKVHILSNKYFKLKTCEQLILSMPLASAPKNEESCKRYIRSLVDFTQELAVCALGGLLYFLSSPLIKLNLPTNFTILSLKVINMDDLVWLGMSTYESLQIFCTRVHPSVYKWTNNSTKVGPSIYGLLNRCRSVLGSTYLKNILNQPTKNINILKYRHELIEFCLQPCNKSIILSLVEAIKHCHCVLSIMVKMNGGNVSMAHWKSLYQTLINAVKIGEICERYVEQTTLFRKIKDALKDGLYIMINYMSCIIDFEQSTKNKRFVVNAGFIPELDEKKSKIKSISQLLDDIAFQELKELPSYIKECSIRKMPEVGFLLCVPLWKPAEKMTEHDYNIQNLDFKFCLIDNVYFKTLRCKELDQSLGEIELSIIQEETHIMIKLSELITQNWISDLHEIVMLIAELDCFISLANVAQDLHLIQPKILPKELCVINIVNGRHILQEQYVDVFVPNSYHSSKESQKIKIITGLNSSGKSIYLKQVALISYLCHIGCYVPAEYTEISVLDHIHIRIQTTESVSTLMSAFMVDLRQMSVALNESTCASLVILDEFGKGTTETNSLALLLASISHFVHRSTNLLPHVIISTHFHSLSNFLQQIVNLDILYRNIKYLQMSHAIKNNKIVCLYKIVDKIEDQNMSLAHNIAALNGLPKCIVERATQVLQLIQNGECVNPMVENLRYQLFYRRKQFVEKVLVFMQDEVTESIYTDLIESLEGVRYP